MELSAGHLIVIDEDLEASDVLALVNNRYPTAAPEEGVMEVAAAELGGPARTWRLTRNSTLTGPIALTPADRERLRLDASAVAGFLLKAPRDREPAPAPEWYADADGLHTLFPQGMPNREEERMLSLLIDIARRLHLYVRLADEPGMDARFVVPDPEAAVDLYVYSPYWLTPEILLERVQAMVPDAYVHEPDLKIDDNPHLSAEEKEQPIVLDGYSIVVPLGPVAGMVTISIMVAEILPSVVRRSVPEGQDQVEYHVHWLDEKEMRFQPEPSEELRRARRDVLALVEAIGREIMQSVAGIGVDENGFLVAAGQLGD